MRLALAVTLFLAAAPPAAAVAPLWAIDAERSEIAFEYAINDAPRAGRFTQMEGEGRFKAEDPGATRLELRIFAEGLALDNPLETAFAKGPEWFDAANHPVARYRLARLEPDGAGGWVALGDLTIKGATVILRTPLSLSVTEDEARAEGALTVDRRDFGLGLGLSDVVLDIADAVTVRFTLTAQAQAQAQAQD